VLSREEAAARREIFLAELGVSDPSLEELRKVPWQRLLEAQTACLEPGPRRIGMFFAPVVDGQSLPTPPIDAIAAGAAREVALIVSTTAEEMQLYHLIPGFPAFDEDQLLAHVQSRLPADLPDREARARAILTAYPQPPDADPLDRFFALETDASLWIPATRLAEAQAAHQPDTWMARFAWRSPMAEGRLGACHALDIPFALANHRHPAVRAFAGEGADADAVANTMAQAWTRFAATGDPQLPDGPMWPRYEPETRATFVIDARSHLVLAPDESRRRVWQGAKEETP